MVKLYLALGSLNALLLVLISAFGIHTSKNKLIVDNMAVTTEPIS